MKEYTYADISVGMEESFTVEITEEKLDMFRKISGDVNPLHGDEEYAQSLGHPGRVAFGMLTASFFSTLAGVYLPGKYCLLHETEFKFSRPVYIGDTLTISGVVSEKNDTFRRLVIKGTAKNQNGKTVAKALIKAEVSK